MKYYLLFVLSLFTFSIYAQNNIIYLTPEELVNNIKNDTLKAAVIQFWIPNCANAKEIVTHYKELEDQYGAKVNFYFIGITNKETLVDTLIEDTAYKYNIYIAAPSVNDDITIRRETFAAKVCHLLNLKKSDFLTMYLKKNGKVIYYGDAIDIKKSKLKEVL
jgi:thiol-disulfide isomerase/thioredoxin